MQEIKVSDGVSDSVNGAIKTFKIISDPWRKISQENPFSFTEVSKSELEKEIKNLNIKNTITLKEVKASAKFLSDYFNNSSSMRWMQENYVVT